ncbi:gigaxonin-like isoform X2 [Patiria miniata]|nr:gigaxonin-like isoform X2 [Patiria miniata]
MNPANQQQPPLNQPAMIRVMRRLRRRMVQGNGDEVADHSDDDEPLEEEQLRELMQRGATSNRTQNKTRFAELLAVKKRVADGKKMTELRKRKMQQKMTPLFLNDCVSALFNNTRLSDVTLKVGPYLFHAHKLILCAWSEVFRAQMNDRWSSSSPNDEPQVHTLNEHEACEEYFEDFLRFFYTEEVNLDEDSVFCILILADKYMVRDLKDVCEKYLLALLETSTAPFVDAMKSLKLAEDLSRVEQKSFSLLENHFHMWTTDDDAVPTLYWFDAELLEKVLQSSNLVVPNELFVFGAIRRWLRTESCKVEREEYTDQLLSLVRFEHIPASVLAHLLDGCSATLEPKVKEYVIQALKTRALAGEEAYEDMCKEFSNPRMYLEPAFCVRITNTEWRIDDGSTFRQLELCVEDSKAEFDRCKLSCPVARQSENKNIYLVSKETWEIGGLAVKESSGEEWSVRFMLKPNFEDIGRSYRVAIVSSKSDPKVQSFNAPFTCVDTGDIGKQIAIYVPATTLRCNSNPNRLWVRVGIQVSGRDKSCDR